MEITWPTLFLLIQAWQARNRAVRPIVYAEDLYWVVNQLGELEVFDEAQGDKFKGNLSEVTVTGGYRLEVDDLTERQAKLVRQYVSEAKEGGVSFWKWWMLREDMFYMGIDEKNKVIYFGYYKD